MTQVNLFLLLPETKPTNRWMRSIRKIDTYKTLIQDLEIIIFEIITIEKYKGFYDAKNINDFLCLYDPLEDSYPNPPKRRLQSVLFNNAFINWREEATQSPNDDYQIFNQPISDNTICEIAERKNKVGNDKYALLNHQACTINTMIAVTINEERSAIEIDNLKDEKEISEWFAQNRLPPRNFNINPKHGENLQDIRTVNGETISPLRCSCQRAKTLLDTAIGKSKKQLYNIDPDYDEIIVFKHEGPTPQNLYHGYYVPKNAEEVPLDIRKKLTKKL